MARMRQQREYGISFKGGCPSPCFAYDSPFYLTNQQPLKKKEKKRDIALQFLGLIAFLHPLHFVWMVVTHGFVNVCSNLNTYNYTTTTA
jgi:hypothetical protein